MRHNECEVDEERCEAGLWIRPRDRNLDDSVLVALDSRNVRYENRAVLHGVQMTPAPLAGIVTRSLALSRPQFSWTHISEEYDVEGGWNEQQKAGFGGFRGGHEGSP